MSSSSAPQTGTSASDTVNLSKLGSGVTYDAGAGNDNITGSSGNDVIRGGSGADRIMGGAGSDTYVFVAGDLVGSLGSNNGQNGSLDHIIDFQGAGSNTGTGFNDTIALYGYSSAATLAFERYFSDRVLQSDGTYKLVENTQKHYYKVTDPNDHSRDGYILVQMQEGSAKLTASDYVFKTDTIIGTDTGNVTEAGGIDNAEVGMPSASGKLTATAFDQVTSFKAPATTDLNGKYGSFTFASDGTWSYALDNTKAETQALKAGEAQTQSLTVQTLDGTTHVITVNVNGTNDAPTGTASAVLPSGTEDTSYVVSKAALLAGFSDVDGDTLSVQNLQATHGFVTDNGNGTYTIVPAANYNGSVALTYTVSDEHGGNISAGQSFALAAVNDAPIASPDAFTTNEDTPHVFTPAGLLGNDSDVDSNVLSVISYTQPAHGTLSLNANGDYVYTPTANYFGQDSFTYQASDGTLNSSPTTVILNVTSVNDAPSVIDDNVTITENDALLKGNVLANDSDIDGGSLTASLTPGGTHYGSLTLNQDGSYVYTLDTANPIINGLNTGEKLVDTYTYTAADGQGGTAQSTLTITICGVTDAPPYTTPSIYTGTGDPNDFDNYTGGSLYTTISNSGLNGPNNIRGTNGNDETIDGKNGADTIYGLAGSDKIMGGQGTDKIYGGSGNDTIEGNQDQDEIYGGSGNDTIKGDQGNDVIVGGYGVDTLTGNEGADTFRFLSARDTGDTITDFSKNQGDKLDFAGLGLHFDGQLSSPGAVTSSGVGYTQGSGDTTVYADIDGNGVADLQITLKGNINLDNSDFKFV